MKQEKPNDSVWNILLILGFASTKMVACIVLRLIYFSFRLVTENCYKPTYIHKTILKPTEELKLNSIENSEITGKNSTIVTTRETLTELIKL